MKKLMCLFSLIFLLALVQPSYAAVGIKINGSDQGAATDLNFDSDRDLGLSGSTLNIPLNLALTAAGVGTGGATSMTTADLAVPISYALVRKAISGDAAFSAGTLADGQPGQMLTVLITAVSGSGTFTITPTTKTGFVSVTFDAAKDQATFLFVDTTTGWIILNTTAVTVNVNP